MDLTIESKRLEFKSPSEGDINSLLILFEENKNLKCEIFGSGFRMIDNLVNHLRKANRSEYFPNRIIFSIYSRLNGEFIGLCGLKIDSRDFKGKLFYVLLSQYHGNGYTIESIKILLNLAFSRLNLNQVIAEIPYNFKDAWKPAERAGLKYIGDFDNFNQDSRFLLFMIDKKEYLNQVFY